MKHHSSYFENEQDCIKTILELHNGGNDIDCDPMFFKGGFYNNGKERKVNIPKFIFDISPRVDYCRQGNAENLPFAPDMLQSMILDPLFLFGIHGKVKNYYTSGTMGVLQDFAELERHYKAILKEAYRVLVKNGLLIFKCQDYTDGKTTMTHCFVWQWAREVGFYAKDLAILNIQQTKIYNGNLTQRHLRKVHTYFWVFIKKGRRENNEQKT